MTSTLLEDQYTFLNIYLSVLVRMRNILDQHCIDNQNTHSKTPPPPPENRVVYEILWKNVIGSETGLR